jgi:Cupredoxin-like domain
VAALLALAVGGCGHVAHVGADGSVQIALNEYRVTPQDVHAGSGTLTFVVHNYGRLTHDLVITRDGRQAAASEPLAPGQTTDLVATLTPGQYLMSSTILSDQALGAYGTLKVR